MVKRIRGDSVSEGGIEALLEAARIHGEESDPDHEVGDLQEIIRTCWALLSPRARREVLDEHRELISEWIEDED